MTHRHSFVIMCRVTHRHLCVFMCGRSCTPSIFARSAIASMLRISLSRSSSRQGVMTASSSGSSTSTVSSASSSVTASVTSTSGSSSSARSPAPSGSDPPSSAFSRISSVDIVGGRSEGRRAAEDGSGTCRERGRVGQRLPWLE